jgi:hypothetical protein
MSKIQVRHGYFRLMVLVLCLAFLFTACGEGADGAQDTYEEETQTESITSSDLHLNTKYYRDGDRMSYCIIFYEDGTLEFNDIYAGTYALTSSTTIEFSVPELTDQPMTIEIIDAEKIYDSSSDITYLVEGATVAHEEDVQSSGLMIGEGEDDEYKYYLNGDQDAMAIEFPSYNTINIYVRTENSSSVYSTSYTVNGSEIATKMPQEGMDDMVETTLTIIDPYTIMDADGNLYTNIGFNPAYTGTVTQGSFDYSVWHAVFVAVDGSRINFTEDTFFAPDPAIFYTLVSEKGDGAYQSGTILIRPGQNISDDGLTIIDTYNAYTLDGDVMYVTTVGDSTNGDHFSDVYYREGSQAYADVIGGEAWQEEE